MQILLTGFLAFIATNLDDIFILMLFYGNAKFSEKQIVTGQFLGIGALIAISLIASLLGLLIDQSYIGLLGLVPIYLGVMALWEILKNKQEETEELQVSDHGNILTVAGATIANGGDNIGIYVPLFAAVGWSGKITMSLIFLLMTFIWCLIARYLTKHPYVARLIDQYGHIITPFVLIVLGVFILKENGTIRLIKDLF